MLFELFATSQQKLAHAGISRLKARKRAAEVLRMKSDCPVGSVSRVRPEDVAVGQMIEELLADAPLGFVAFDERLVVTYSNASAKRLSGRTYDDLIGTGGLDLVHPNDLAVVVDSLAMLADASRETVPVVLRILGSDGSYRSLETWIQKINHDSIVARYIVTFRDARSSLEVDAYIESMLSGKDLATGFGSLAWAIEAELGFKVSIHWQWDGANFRQVISPDPTFESIARTESVNDAVSANRRLGIETFGIETLRGSEIHSALRNHRIMTMDHYPVCIENRNVACIVVWHYFPGRVGPAADQICRRMARLAALALVRNGSDNRLKSLATTDSLTGLANRARFSESLCSALSGIGNCSVVVLDLDGFKAINDSHGHLVGDEVLVEVGKRLQAVVRESDLVARLGGDEFAILLTAPTSEEELRGLEALIRSVLRRPIATTCGDLTISSSIGYASNSYSSDANALMSRADRAMYINKRAHKLRRLSVHI